MPQTYDRKGRKNDARVSVAPEPASPAAVVEAEPPAPAWAANTTAPPFALGAFSGVDAEPVGGPAAPPGLPSTLVQLRTGPAILRQPADDGTPPPVEPPAAPGAPSAPATETAPSESVPRGASRATGSAPAESGSEPTAGCLIVEDQAEPTSGQMRKSEFLAALKDAVCRTTEEALAGTPWSATGCPWIEHWFGYYGDRDSAQVERAIRRYVPESAPVASAADYIPLITARVRNGIQAWSSTGEMPAIPAEAADQVQAATAGEAAINRKAFGGAEAVPAASPAAVQAQLGSGMPLDSAVRSRVGPALGADLSRVRVHTDYRAAALSSGLDARAFAVGQHVAFAAGEYRPGTLIGDALITHELAHVVQQQDSATSSGHAASTAELESEADSAAVSTVARMWSWSHVLRNAGPRLRSGLSLQRCKCRKAVTFTDYQNLFNSRWNTAPFNTMSAGPDATLDSHGPRTPRARAIFNDILAADPRLQTAYDSDSAIRQRIDTFMGPEGLNLIGSPRLDALQAAFTGFAKPVPVASLPALKAAVTTAATALNAADRTALENSNEWQQLINDYVTDDTERGNIRAIISPPPAPAPAGPAPAGPAPAGPAPAAGPTPAQRAHVLTTWRPEIGFWDGSRQVVFAAPAVVSYFYGGQTFTAAAVLPPPDVNPGLTLSVRSQILRGGAAVVGPTASVQFPPNQSRTSSIAMPITAPSPVPAGGDPLTFRVEIMEPAAAGPTVVSTNDVLINVQAGQVYTQVQAEAAATADDTFIHDVTPAGLIGIMRGHGGLDRNIADAIVAGTLHLRPLTVRHDSAAYVAAARMGVPHPELLGYFLGTTYATSTVLEAGAAGFSVGGAGSGDIVVNRSLDVVAGTKRNDAEVIMFAVHEGLHNLDKRPASGTPIERYKTEFRSYWMDGRFGPPNGAPCGGAAGCLDAAYDPTLPPPGPKSPRARAIFQVLYGSVTYSWVQSNYDDNTAGFREAVDNYLIPDGINLIGSLRLEALRALIEGWAGTGYPAFRASVQAFMGIGAAPAGGVLDPDDRNEVIRNRSWRDLVERKVADTTKQRQIKNDLSIP
jgi:hypothetical protein